MEYGLNCRLGSNIEESADFTTIHKTCCATFFSIIAYRSGLLDSESFTKCNYHSTRTNGLQKMFTDAGWKGNINEEDVQPGDICLYPPSNGKAGHIFMYLGNGYTLDQSIACIIVNPDTGERISGPAEDVEQDWEDYKNNHDLMIWRPSELEGAEEYN